MSEFKIILTAQIILENLYNYAQETESFDFVITQNDLISGISKISNGQISLCLQYLNRSKLINSQLMKDDIRRIELSSRAIEVIENNHL